MWTSVPSVSDSSDVVVAVAGVVCSSNNFTLLALLTFVKFSSRLAAFGLCVFFFFFGFLLCCFSLGVSPGCGCCASAKADKLFSRFFYDAAAAAACCGLALCVCVCVCSLIKINKANTKLNQ